jgi:predicted MFS family arabinose efflux permease
VGGLPESVAVLRQRDFRLVFGAFAVSVLGDRMVNIALAFAVLGLGGSPSDIGIVLASRTVPLVAALLVGGVVADRMSRQVVMVGADLSRVVTQGTIAVLLLTGEPPIWTLALLAGLTGVATGFFNPAAGGLLPLVVAPEHLQQANGLRATAASSGEIIAPALAGVIVASAGAGWAFAIDSATFAVSAMFLAGLRLPPRLERAPSSFIADLREGWGAFSSRAWVWSMVVTSGLAALMWGAFSVLGPVVAEQDLGGAAAWGSVMAGFGIGALAGSLVAIRVRPRRPLVVHVFALALYVVPIALLAAGMPVGVLAAGTLFAGVGLMLGDAVWESTLQRRIPTEQLSRVSAYDWFGGLAFAPIGLMIWGPVAAAIGIETALWVAAGLMLLVVLAPLAVRDVRTMPGA